MTKQHIITHWANLNETPGVLLERMGSGAGLTISGVQTQNVNLTLPNRYALTDITYMEMWWAINSSSDIDTLTVTLNDSAAELTTDKYENVGSTQLADGTPVPVDAENYLADVLHTIATVSNVAGETINGIFRLMRPNDLASHKPGHLRVHSARSDDDNELVDQVVMVLTANALRGFKLAMTTGNLVGKAGIRAVFGLPSL